MKQEAETTTSTTCNSDDTMEVEPHDIDPLDICIYDEYDGDECECDKNSFARHTCSVMSCKCKGYTDIGFDRYVCCNCWCM